MGKRFGRNQRRALREQVRNLGAELDQMAGIAADWRDKAAKQHAKRHALEQEAQEWGARILRYTREDGVFQRMLFEVGVDGKMAEYLASGNPMLRRPALVSMSERVPFAGIAIESQMSIEAIRAFATYLEAREEHYPHPGVLFLCKTPDERFYFMADRETLAKEIAHHSGGEVGRFIQQKLVKAIKDHAGLYTARPAKSAPPR